MAQVRGIATVGTLLLLSMTLLHCKIAHAATYTVGGDDGWTFNVNHWPEGKKFVTGDVLVFSYGPEEHDVVVVNKEGYENCSAPSDPKTVYRSGDDHVTLVKGDNYFICDFPEHCNKRGMRIAVTAA